MPTTKNLFSTRARMHRVLQFRPPFAFIAVVGTAVLFPMAGPCVDRTPAAENISERVGVVLDANADGDIHERIHSLADMATAEDLEGYLACFTRNRSRKLRKDAASAFVRHEVQLEIVDSHVVNIRGNRSEVAVKYRAILSEWEYEVVSLLTMAREDGYWKISSEEIQEFQIDGPSICTPSRYTCMGGRCRLASR